jgi:enamine deaminase RidA (YjgF/YER057c/UK114 family)
MASTVSSYLEFRKDDALIQRINPPGLHQTPGYHHVTVVDVTKMVFLAGQCPLDEWGQLVGPDDLSIQVEQVIRNIIAALSSVGATPDDVVRTVIYVVSAHRDDLSLVWTILRNSAIASALSTASTLLGVSQLGYPGQLVEIDMTAIQIG